LPHEENALKLGIEEGEKAFKFQTNYINNVNENAKETAKNRYTEVQEARKAIEKKIEILDKYKRDIGDNKEKKIWYNTEWLEISEVQRRIGEEISKLKSQLNNLK
jgi:flagellar biosynthesis chaperone FliJ